MNVVLLADKKTKKSLESAVKKNAPSINLLGAEPAIRSNTISRITEHYNPHTLVIFNGIPEKDGVLLQDLISLIKLKRSSMRIVFIYGKIKDIPHFQSVAAFMLDNGIYDISLESSDEKIIELIENPMSKADSEILIKSVEEKDKEAFVITDNKVTSIKVEDIKEDNISLSLDFPSVTLKEFDIDRIETVIDNEVKTKDAVSIAIGELQHHNGCTHTAFEIASMLTEEKKNVCIVMIDDDTYRNLTRFYNLNPEAVKDGLNVKGIDIYPYSKLSDVKEIYDCTICDYGYLREHHHKTYGAASIKIMLCSAAEWDITSTLNYINYANNNYTRDIHYCFSRVSKPKFIGYNKQLLKANCVAYRLHNSPDWLNPCNDNRVVYREIMRRYELSSDRKFKRSLVRIK